MRRSFALKCKGTRGEDRGDGAFLRNSSTAQAFLCTAPNCASRRGLYGMQLPQLPLANRAISTLAACRAFQQGVLISAGTARTRARWLRSTFQ